MSVRRFTRTKDIPGLSVRLPKADIKNFEIAKKKLLKPTLNKLLGELAMCILAALKSGDKGVVRHGLILEAEKNSEAVKYFYRILKRKPGTVPNKRSYPKWVPVEEKMKATLVEVATKLHWSEGQVIQESIRAAVFLICHEDAEVLPDIFVLFWGRIRYEEIWAEAMKEKREIEGIKNETRKKGMLKDPPAPVQTMSSSVVLQ